MSTKLLFLFFAQFLFLQWNDAFANTGSSESVCGSRPADVIFVLDSSGSISNRNFNRQIRFVIDVIDQFPIGRGSNRVGMVSFSNWAQLEFHLNAYETKAQVTTAIEAMFHMKGDTNTAAALAYVRDVMLTSENGARPEVPHVVVVLTDGRSNDPRQTALEAARLKRRTDVHLFAIGVGAEVDRLELTNMASAPSEQYVFTVQNYAALKTIKDLLTNKTCQVTNPPTTTFVTATPDPLVQVDQACGSRRPVDVLFAASPLANHNATRTTLMFFRDIASRLNIGPDAVRVGIVPRDCDAVVPAIGLREAPEWLVRRLNQRLPSQSAAAAAAASSSSSVLRYVNDVGFGREGPAGAGATPRRANVKRTALMVVDSALDGAAVDEAIRAKAEGSGVELTVVVVGKEALGEEARAIASSDDHLFHVSAYDELSSLVDKVASSICPA